MSRAVTPSQPLHFIAAVEKPLSVVFRRPDGGLEGHDYTVELIAARPCLDELDVVMDFRDLEAALSACLMPLDGHVSDVSTPLKLAERLAAQLASAVSPPAWLVELALTDGRGRRVAVRRSQ